MMYFQLGECGYLTTVDLNGNIGEENKGDEENIGWWWCVKDDFGGEIEEKRWRLWEIVCIPLSRSFGLRPEGLLSMKQTADDLFPFELMDVLLFGGVFLP